MLMVAGLSLLQHSLLNSHSSCNHLSLAPAAPLASMPAGASPSLASTSVPGHPSPSLLSSTSELGECHAFPHTEFSGGMVVGGGARFKLPNASVCCAACLAHNRAKPRPRGRLNCTTWVYNSDTSHHQAQECWLKRHTMPWADIDLLVGGARSWVSGLTEPSPDNLVMGARPTARSCGDSRWRSGATNRSAPLYHHPRTPTHKEELSLCAPVQPAEASLALVIGDERVRLRLNRAESPKATGWIESLLAHGTCAPTNRSRCAPHCCQFYRAEAVVGVHRLPDAILQAHQLDPERPPRWGSNFWWGAPYGFIQGRLWHGGPGPWKPSDTNLPAEHYLPALHRGTVELVGQGPDFLIALADHPMMPPHNAFAHVVEEDMPILDRLIERGPLKVQNWGSINATVFERAVPFALRRL